ncbi:hypothetical protein [Crateriforma conspicua]|uniref:Uncharacterized protein n=1 Tax=Crateriforma conspicua TaxID=2527996 RepID=A0A5C5XPZ1_9PLAN|nr:hypothetical protein [Crateriforma conspicua]TWT64954.1 hypothetical protein Pan14r_54560 [Crateriforma conspicua]
MSASFSAPIWLIFAALAIPLLLVAVSAFHASEIYEIDDDPDADVATMQSVLDSGTVVQTVEYPGFGSAKVVTFFGPFGIAANARPWAAIIVTCGLMLTAIGMFGLLHFPSRVPVVNYDAVQYSEGDDAMPEPVTGNRGEPSDAPESR